MPSAPRKKKARRTVRGEGENVAAEAGANIDLCQRRGGEQHRLAAQGGDGVAIVAPASTRASRRVAQGHAIIRVLRQTPSHPPLRSWLA